MPAAIRLPLEIEDIKRVLPHRYPFLLVDRVLEIEDGKRIVGMKNVTINEPFFQGHFPGHPIMPGVLIIEAMAQVGGVLLMGSVPDRENKVVYFTSLNNVKWRRPVKPGDQLRFELELLQVRGMMCKMSGVAKVDGQVVCGGVAGGRHVSTRSARAARRVRRPRRHQLFTVPRGVCKSSAISACVSPWK
jgi:beta-hydroxyacyl-ACP dehydratase FabZ